MWTKLNMWPKMRPKMKTKIRGVGSKEPKKNKGGRLKKKVASGVDEGEKGVGQP